MNAERLLAHYERIADAPNAIPRLRRFVLDLAVRGNLVPQDPNDEPASELLKRIAAEKARLVKAGRIRKGKPLPAISEDELPFELPRGWAWTRLGDLVHLVSGQHLQPPEYSKNPKGRLPYITGPSDFGPNGLQINRFALVRKAVAQKGQLLLTVKGSGVGKTATCDIPEVAISRQLMALSAIAWNDRFLILITHRLAEKLQEEARSLIPGISREDVEEFVFPLPSLAEQGRIVAKVDELMALCDRLEAARAEREAIGDKLTAASYSRLNVPDPETFRDDARFALDGLPALTARPDQIKQLRQTILNLAVRGKLVPQNPNHLGEGGVETINTEMPFQAPLGWHWCEFAQDAKFENGDRGKNYPNRSEYVEKGIAWINTGHIQPDGSLSVPAMNYITREKYESLGGGKITPNDLLYCLRGATFGKTAFVEPFTEGAIAHL